MMEQNGRLINAVRNHGKKLLNVIRKSIKNDEDAEDILQDIWYQLSAAIDTQTIENLGAWLHKVARNRIIDKKRRKSNVLLDDIAIENDDGENIYPAGLLEDKSNPETKLLESDRKKALFKAIDELPEKQRTVFVLNEIEEVTLKEIAEMSGESLKTIISRKRYAVAALRKKLENYK